LYFSQMSNKSYKRLKWVIGEKKEWKQNTEIKWNRLERDTSQVVKHIIKTNVRNVLSKTFIQKQVHVLIMSDKKKKEYSWVCKICVLFIIKYI
jgi:hypothetical protein